VTNGDVLIVNDDQAAFGRLEQYFHAKSPELNVMSVISGPRAIGMASARPPDVIIVDAELGDMDGYRLVATLRAQPGLEKTPVVIIATRPSEQTAARAREVGATALLPASGDPAVLLQTVLRIVGRGAPDDSDLAVAGRSAGAIAAQSRVTPAVSVASSPRRPSLDELLVLLLERGGSDLHLTVGSPPGLRLRGEIVPVENCEPLSPTDMSNIVVSIMTDAQRQEFENELEIDFAYVLPGVSRFRVSIFQQRNSIRAVLRAVPLGVPTIEELRLPEACRTLADRPRGLVLVTGPTGSGKSTTLAAMIDHINATKPFHIVTLEDPIEFVHRDKRSYVSQREIGQDSHSFASALRRILRQDPDVILVGEMRDLETIAAAVTAAETGHLVLATLHTTGGPETVDRIVDVFPSHQQQQIRVQLSATLEGVISQVLLRSPDGKSRALATEVMVCTAPIANLIREGKTHQMANIIQTSQDVGMQTLDQDLKTLINAGVITFDEGVSKAKDPHELAALLGRHL
jgi:twitching motility protein PilT